MFDLDALKKNFEREVARMMAKKFEGLLPIFDQILQEENAGFNVWAGYIVESDHHDTRKFLGRYLMRHPFSFERITVKKICSRRSLNKRIGDHIEKYTLRIPGTALTTHT